MDEIRKTTHLLSHRIPYLASIYFLKLHNEIIMIDSLVNRNDTMYKFNIRWKIYILLIQRRWQYKLALSSKWNHRNCTNQNFRFCRFTNYFDGSSICLIFSQHTTDDTGGILRLSSNSSWDESTQSSLAYVIFSYLSFNDNKLEISGQIYDVTDGVYFVTEDTSSKFTRLTLEEIWTILPPANEVLGKVIFSQASVCPEGEGCYDVTSCYGQHPPPMGSTTPLPVNKRSLRILLECFLVFN